ncbi:uncharacterized protein [Miscanthus floridulus]|uniref:uncharacterized protein n=1 Tax=Miscanthus floridulus TaxID=154761 RepID=UPI003459920F
MVVAAPAVVVVAPAVGSRIHGLGGWIWLRVDRPQRLTAVRGAVQRRGTGAPCHESTAGAAVALVLTGVAGSSTAWSGRGAVAARQRCDAGARGQIRRRWGASGLLPEPGAAEASRVGSCTSAGIRRRPVAGQGAVPALLCNCAVLALGELGDGGDSDRGWKDGRVMRRRARRGRIWSFGTWTWHSLEGLARVVAGQGGGGGDSKGCRHRCSTAGSDVAGQGAASTGVGHVPGGG